MGYISRIKEVLSHPMDFFGRLREEGIKSAFVYYLFLSLFATIMGVIMHFVYGSALRSVFPSTMFEGAFVGFYTGLIIVASLIGWIIGLGLLFVVVAVLHVWIKIFKGKKEYSKTCQLYVYSNTPTLLLGWIPVVGFLAQLYSLVLLIVGTHKMHELSLRRSILMYLIPVAIIIILYFVGAAFLLPQLGGSIPVVPPT